jgi:hypothetical protein
MPTSGKTIVREAAPCLRGVTLLPIMRLNHNAAMNNPLIRLACLVLMGIYLRHPANAAYPPAEKWNPFRNMEQVVYCLSLPLGGYTEDFRKNEFRGQHVFVNKAKKKTEITLHGLHRSDKKISIENYYRNHFEGAEEKGWIIEHRALDASARRFYSTSYWSNTIRESRQLEIVWLRDTEIVKFHVKFPLEDTGLWKARLPELLKQTAHCKPGE